ncbi:hypothetical protein EON64_06065, partial [archaeon]
MCLCIYYTYVTPPYTTSPTSLITDPQPLYLYPGSDQELDECRGHLYWQLMRLKVFPLYPFSFVVQEYR